MQAGVADARHPAEPVLRRRHNHLLLVAAPVGSARHTWVTGQASIGSPAAIAGDSLWPDHGGTWSYRDLCVERLRAAPDELVPVSERPHGLNGLMTASERVTTVSNTGRPCLVSLSSSDERTSSAPATAPSCSPTSGS